MNITLLGFIKIILKGKERSDYKDIAKRVEQQKILFRREGE